MFEIVQFQFSIEIVLSVSVSIQMVYLFLTFQVQKWAQWVTIYMSHSQLTHLLRWMPVILTWNPLICAQINAHFKWSEWLFNTVYGTYAYTMLLILLCKGGDWTIIYFQYWEMNFTMRDLQVG